MRYYLPNQDQQTLNKLFYHLEKTIIRLERKEVEYPDKFHPKDFSFSEPGPLFYACIDIEGERIGLECFECDDYFSITIPVEYLDNAIEEIRLRLHKVKQGDATSPYERMTRHIYKSGTWQVLLMRNTMYCYTR